MSQSVNSVTAPASPELPLPPAADRALAIWGDAEAERAAIVENEGKVPREWAEGFARLDPERAPADVPPQRWQQFIDDVGRFLDGWAGRAAELGWGPLDIFGCDRERPFARIDAAGLLWLVGGGRIVELDRAKAVIEDKTGARQTFRRRPVPVGHVALAWDLIL